MHKELLEALKAAFPGVSESILNRIATKLAKTVTTAEEVKTAVEGVTIQQVIESYGDSRATEAQQTAVSNYEKKYGLKDGAKVTSGGAPETKTEPENKSEGEDVPAWAKALIDGQKALGDRLNAMEGDNLSKSRKAELAAITGQLPESLRKAYDRTPVDGLSDEEFAALKESVTGEVAEIAKTANAKGAVFGKPSVPGGKPTGDEALTKEQIAAIQRRDGAAGAGTDQQPF